MTLPQELRAALGLLELQANGTEEELLMCKAFMRAVVIDGDGVNPGEALTALMTVATAVGSLIGGFLDDDARRCMTQTVEKRAPKIASCLAPSFDHIERIGHVGDCVHDAD